MIDFPAPVSALTQAQAQTASQARADDPLWKAAQNLERTFLTEMLKSAGLGASRTSFGGGVGEDQFSSYLREAQAGAMVEAGGIGLAEQLFKALQEADE